MQMYSSKCLSIWEVCIGTRHTRNECLLDFQLNNYNGEFQLLTPYSNGTKSNYLIACIIQKGSVQVIVLGINKPIGMCLH